MSSEIQEVTKHRLMRAFFEGVALYSRNDASVLHRVMSVEAVGETGSLFKLTGKHDKQPDETVTRYVRTID